MDDHDLVTATGQALLRAYGCPVCGSREAACGSLESATPKPILWCPHLENTLERRGWRHWAQQYLDQERRTGGYSQWLRAKRRRLAGGKPAA
jgi:hypothetical protein